MYKQDDIYNFIVTQRSTVAAVENFLEQFMDIHGQLGEKDQELLTECFQQMFRKYYYSTLISDTPLTPANIFNTLTEREYGKKLMVVPKLELIRYKNKRIKDIRISVCTLGREEHFFVRDMESLLEFAREGVAVIEPGIIPPERWGSLEETVMLPDRHYVNILCMAALEAGWLEKDVSMGVYTAFTAREGEEFLELEAEEKLDRAVKAVVKLCSRSILEALPFLEKDFSEEGIMELLRKPKDYGVIIKPVLKKLGLDMNRLTKVFFEDDFDENTFLSQLDDEANGQLLAITCMLDMYFYTPFGYYLQLIQPIYVEGYDMEEEVECILEHSRDMQQARLQLYSPAFSYDLTALGEKLLLQSRKPKRKQLLPKEAGDEEMYEAVEASRNGADIWDDDMEDMNCEADEEIEGFSGIIDLQEKREKRKIKAESKEQGLRNKADDRIFVFNVKPLGGRKSKKQVEVGGNKTLDDLHESIFQAFRLDDGHLYSFFMSNRAWDARTEYSHPMGNGRPADKVRIGGLGLRVKQKFMYIYDYGDEYRFEIELAEIKE